MNLEMITVLSLTLITVGLGILLINHIISAYKEQQEEDKREARINLMIKEEMEKKNG